MLLSFVEHVVAAVVFLALLGSFLRGGLWEMFRVVVVTLKQVPYVEGAIGKRLKSEATSFIKSTKLASEEGKGEKISVTIPKSGIPRDTLLDKLKEMKAAETNTEEGKVFAYTYTVTDDHYKLQEEVFDAFTDKIGHSPDHDSLVRHMQSAFLNENALNPMVYTSLRKMETEVVAMTAALLNGDSQCVGFLTSGGTESILMAVKTHRNRARVVCPWIKEPEIVAPLTIHPAFNKAAHYFGLRVVLVPVAGDLRADVHAMEQAITKNTVLIACSAPQFCHGVVDPIQEISNMAARHGIPCHVDACFGGYMLPWIEKLGYDVPVWDFRCPGVISVSADIHKYGYSVKGSSVILYRDEDYRKHQIFSYGNWPGGLYGSPSMAGSRPGSNIAAAWTALNHLGEDGYMDRARTLMDITCRLKEAVTSIKGLKIMGTPHMTCFAIGSDDPEVDILVVADLMENKGWVMERQQNPSCLHCSIMPHHQASVDSLIQDLNLCTQEARVNKHLSKQGTAGIYGMMATIPDATIVEDFVKEFFSEVNKHLSKQGTAGIYGMMATIPDATIVEDFVKEFFSEVYKIQQTSGDLCQRSTRYSRRLVICVRGL